MLIALAATAPTAMHSSVRAASQPGRCSVKAAVGEAFGSVARVAEAAPTVSRITQGTNTPSPAAQPTAFGLASAGR